MLGGQSLFFRQAANGLIGVRNALTEHYAALPKGDGVNGNESREQKYFRSRRNDSKAATGCAFSLTGERWRAGRLDGDVLRETVKSLRAEQRDKLWARPAGAYRFAEGMRRGLEEGGRADIPAHRLFPPLRQ
jgi:hypothetical protein